MGNFQRYPHDVGIPWQDEADRYSLEESVRMQAEAHNNKQPISKLAKAKRLVKGGIVQGGRVYDAESGLFVE